MQPSFISTWTEILTIRHETRSATIKQLGLIRWTCALIVGLLEVPSNRYFIVSRAKALWQTSMPSMHSFCCGLIHFSGLSQCFCGASETSFPSILGLQPPPLHEWWCRPPGVTGRGSLFKHSGALLWHRAFLAAQTGGKLSRRWRIATPQE